MTRGVAGSTPQEHGTARYRAGCRCDTCRRAVCRRLKMYRLERARTGTGHTMPRTGTRRRLQALASLGWSWTEIAARLGVDRTAVSGLCRYGGPVLRATADRVADVYDELSMTPGPSNITRIRAAKAGWVPPLAWNDEEIDDPAAEPYRDSVSAFPVVDDVAIARALAGGSVELTAAERVVVVQRLAAEGMPDRRIAERVGVTERTVYRDRRANGIESRWVA